jgi:hypothetical protein
MGKRLIVPKPTAPPALLDNPEFMNQWIAAQGKTLTTNRKLKPQTADAYNLLSVHTPNLKPHVPTVCWLLS